MGKLHNYDIAVRNLRQDLILGLSPFIENSLCMLNKKVRAFVGEKYSALLN